MKEKTRFQTGTTYKIVHHNFTNNLFIGKTFTARKSHIISPGILYQLNLEGIYQLIDIREVEVVSRLT